MIEFEININDIKKIIEPKIEEYKLNEMHKNNINLVIESKINPGNDDSLLKNNLNSIEENNEIKNAKEEDKKDNIIKDN